MEYKAITTRIPLKVYEAIRAYKATAGDISINQFVVDAVEEKLKREQEEQLKLDVQDLADGFDEEEFRLWNEAQRRAMKYVGD